MNAILDELYDLEMHAQNYEASISEQKLDLKRTFDRQKQDLQTKMQMEFDEELAEFKNQADATKDETIEKLQEQFSIEMNKIKQAVENDQPQYVANFMQKVRHLGVTEDE